MFDMINLSLAKVPKKYVLNALTWGQTDSDPGEQGSSRKLL